jgi:serine protease Do
LSAQASIGVTEVLEGSPAEKAGLLARDIIVSIDGQPLPRFKPDQAAVAYFEREIDRRHPGETLKLGVLRDSQKLVIEAVLEDAPELPREAARRYFDFLGITVRKFTYADGAIRRVKLSMHRGVVAHFVKPKSPAAVTGLRLDNWITGIDGTAVANLAEAEKLLAAIEADRARTDYTLSIEREGEVTELRIKLK